MEKTKDDVMELMMKRMKDKIKDQKYKMTSQRQVVLRAFVESTARHLNRRPPISGWRLYTELLICLRKWTC